MCVSVCVCVSVSVCVYECLLIFSRYIYCADGNHNDGDGCNNRCQLEYCGDGEFEFTWSKNFRYCVCVPFPGFWNNKQTNNPMLAGITNNRGLEEVKLFLFLIKCMLDSLSPFLFSFFIFFFLFFSLCSATEAQTTAVEALAIPDASSSSPHA